MKTLLFSKIVTAGLGALLLCLQEGGVHGLRCDTTARHREKISEEAVKKLWQSGDFEVIQGNLSFNRRQLGNPAGRYGTLSVPHWAQPLVLCNASQSPSTIPIPFSFCSIALTLGPRDAIVWLGCTPPPAAYFSLRSYVAFRFEPQFWFPAVELGDPANHLVMNTTGGHRNPFSKTAWMISTGDEETERIVRGAFIDSGLDPSIANLDVIPQDKTHFRDRSKLWIQDRSDAIAWQFRVSQFHDPMQAEEYLEEVWPIYYIRARHHYEKAGTKPLIAPPARSKGNGNSQEVYLPSLESLEERVIKAYESQGSSLTHRFPMDHIVPDLQRCLDDPTYKPIFQNVSAWGFPGWASCDWFSADALYTGLPNTTDLRALTFPINRTYVILGVNQPKLKKAVYSNLMVTAVYHFEDPEHSVNLTASDLQGSVSAFAGDLEKAEDLWVFSFGRDCQASPSELQPFCRDVPTSMINETELLYVVERKYLEPETKTGPDPNEIQPPLVLIFDKMTPTADAVTTALPAPADPTAASSSSLPTTFGDEEDVEELTMTSRRRQRRRSMRG